MKETLSYLNARIEALEKLAKIQEDFIQEQAKIIDEVSFKYADSKARYNMLVRNIQVIDSIIEQPIKN